MKRFSQITITKQTAKSSSVVIGSGGVAEWSIAAVLKTVEAQASGGSNPSPSAILKCCREGMALRGFRYIRLLVADQGLFRKSAEGSIFKTVSSPFGNISG